MSTLPEMTELMGRVQEEIASILAIVSTAQDTLGEMIEVTNQVHDWAGGHAAYMASQGLSTEPADHAVTELETLRERLEAAKNEAEQTVTTALEAANSAAEDAELALAEIGSKE